MREECFTRLRVVDASALQIASVRRSDDERRRECPVRAIAHGRQLVSDLVERRPDVVEELDLDDGVHPSERLSDGSSNDVRLSERRVVHPLCPELRLKAMRDFENTALSLHLTQRRGFGHVGDVFAEHHDARIALHL